MLGLDVERLSTKTLKVITTAMEMTTNYVRGLNALRKREIMQIQVLR